MEVNMTSEPGDLEKTSKPAGRPKPASDDRTVPLSALSAVHRKLFEETPRKEWYRIKAVRATYQETVELVAIANALEYLIKVTPERLLQRVMDGEVEEAAFYAGFRAVRDVIRLLREKLEHLAKISGVELRAWSDGRGRKRRHAPAALTPPLETLRKAS
jgi:hypothetical protein